MAALTPEERASVRLYLGWPARFYQAEPALEQSMNALDQSDDATHGVVISLLASLADVDAKLVDAHNRLKAKKVGSIELMEDKEVQMLRSEGRRFAGRLAAVLGVEIRHDVFSGMGPSFDETVCNELCIG